MPDGEERRMRMTRILAAAALLAPGFAMAQTRPAPEPAVVTRSAERVAIVETVNMQERSVLLRGAGGAQDGALATVRVGPAMRNLGQVRPGDRVVVTVTDSLVAALVRPDDRQGARAGATVVTRAAEGQRPGASVTEAERVRVRVDSIQPLRNRVFFTLPSGEQREARIEDPRLRQFVRGLNPGDMVDVVMLETVSLRVLPPG
jgi:translation initiation factor IF-1